MLEPKCFVDLLVVSDILVNSKTILRGGPAIPRRPRASPGIPRQTRRINGGSRNASEMFLYAHCFFERFVLVVGSLLGTIFYAFFIFI